MAEKGMRNSKAVALTLFCENCGDTRTFRKDYEFPLPTVCKQCLNGTMIEAIHTAEPDATE